MAACGSRTTAPTVGGSATTCRSRKFYHASVDDRDPYQVYGGLQDNSSWVGDSEYPDGITNSRWENLYGGDGFWVFTDQSDPNFVYAEAQGGFIGRIDRHTLTARDIQPKAGYREKLRWNWNTPIHVSRLEKGKVYVGAQFLFVTKDAGQSWQRISPDLTTDDPQKQKQEQSGGITVDNSAAEMHTTIYSISESPRDAKTIWSGPTTATFSSRATAERRGPIWQATSPVAARQLGLVGRGRAACGCKRVRRIRPAYVRRHDPMGLRDARLRKDLDAHRGCGVGRSADYAHVIKEDPVRPGLLFLGTEFGLWISLDAGKTWAEFKGGNFPPVAVRDLAFQARQQDLTVARTGGESGSWTI